MGNTYDKIQLIEPKFGSKITRNIFELEELRDSNNLLKFFDRSNIDYWHIFFSFIPIFQTLESIASARIEWNHTTVSEYANKVYSNRRKWWTKDEKIKDINNNINARDYINEVYNTWNLEINRKFLSELHILLMKDLDPKEEWDYNPWHYRKKNVNISLSSHTPPDYTQVEAYMDELIDFINTKDDRMYDLIKIALVHHRFVWIHPFWNWNWRMVRLLTYALFLKYWYAFNQVNLMNTSSLFCLNREEYYKYLNLADWWDKDWLLKRCEFATSSICAELKNIKKFFDMEFVNSILEKWIKKLRTEKEIDDKEADILTLLYLKWWVDNKTVQQTFKYNTSIISRKFRHLKEIWLLRNIEKTKQYVPTYENRTLFIEIYHNLIKEWFSSWSILDEPEWLSEVLPK